MEVPVHERFWSKVDTSGACWNWTAAIDKAGYGRISGPQRTMLYAHRTAWELTYGAIPPGLFVCHHCDNRRCVNPKHLFVGSSYQNTHDMLAKNRGQANKNSAKTHCPKGHPYAGSNLIRLKSYTGNGRRDCRACRLESAKLYKRTIRARHLRAQSDNSTCLPPTDPA